MHYYVSCKATSKLSEQQQRFTNLWQQQYYIYVDTSTIGTTVFYIGLGTRRHS